MGGLTVLVTSPRLPAGLLTRAAWQAIEAADVVAAADVGAPLAAAVSASGIDVAPLAGADSRQLLAMADQQAVVWLAEDEGDEALTRQLAEAVVRRAETPGSGPDVEIMLGSFDPPGARLLDAVVLMDVLRQRCPWDSEQTHGSLVRYLLEEAYELVEAIEAVEAPVDTSSSGADGAEARRDLLREELGDLLFQVLFHARIAAEHPDRPFTIDDVAGELVEKLVRRHPHVFADTEVSGPADVEANWELIKRAEKGRRSAMDGIPSALPALSLAASVIARALRAKASVSVPVPDGEPVYTEDTLGEVLFALVAAAHAGGLDAERALRARVRSEMAALRAAEQRAVPGDGESSR